MEQSTRRFLFYLLTLQCVAGLNISETVTIRAPKITPEIYFEYLISLLHRNLPCLSCKGRCGSTEDIPADIFNEKGACTCDKSCVKFGNCCPDITHVCPELNIKMTSFELLTRSKKTECYSKGRCHQEAMYLLINDCPFSKCNVCQRTNKNAKTGVPVVDLDTNISYSNALCALCNGATNLIPWEIKYNAMGCQIRDECNIPAPDVWTPDLANIIDRFHPSPLLRPRQRCNGITWKISACSNKWPQDIFRQACENGGFSLVYFEEPRNLIIKNYKNLFCAICNFEEIQKLKCNFMVTSMVCDDPKVFSLEKLFSVGSDHGMQHSMCKEGETYIEKENRCREVHVFDSDQFKPFFEAQMILHYRDETELPFDRASALIKSVEREYNDLDFYIGRSNRNWEHGLDDVRLGATKDMNFTGNFISTAVNITNLWTELQKYNKHGMTLIISTINKDCEYLSYNLSAATFDEKGSVNILGGPAKEPGQYHVINNTIYTCIEKSDTWIYSSTIGWVTIISMTISVICLIILLILKCVYPSTGKNIIIILSVCLLVSHMSFLIGPQLQISYPACYMAGVILHWAFLASFAWMAAIAFDICFLVTRAEKLERTSQKSSHWKLLLPFLFPTFTVIVSIAIEESTLSHPWRPLYGSSLCWFNSNNALLIYFVAPVGVYVLVTAILTIVTAVKLCYITQDLRQAERDRFGTFVKLSVLTGLSWTFGFIAVPSGNVVLFILFVVLNASQGLFLLIAIWAPTLRKRIQSSDFSLSGTKLTSLRSGSRSNEANQTNLVNSSSR